MYFQDIDMPDYSGGSASYDGQYAEGITPGDGVSRTVHTLEDTLLVANGEFIHGTAETPDSTTALKSAFAAHSEAPFSFTWHGGDAGTQMFAPVNYPRGNLTVKKVVNKPVNDYEADTATYDFTVTFTGDHAPEPMTFSLTNGESHTIRGIPENVTATVTEATSSSYTTSWEPSNAALITGGSDTTLTCTNTLTGQAVTLIKKAADTNAGLNGAKLRLRNTKTGRYANVENGSVSAWVENARDATTLTSTGNGYVEVGGLYEGAYAFEEIEAPDGYLPTEDVEFALAFDGTPSGDNVVEGKVVMVDDPKPRVALPGTGGTGQDTAGAILGLVLVIVPCAEILRRRRATNR